MTRLTDPKRPSPDSPPESTPTSLERRTFLKTGTLAGAAALAGATDASRAQSADSAAQDEVAATPVMTAQAEAAPPADVQVMAADERAGSDYMVDVFKSLDFEYFCANPGSSFRGLHESVINYGGNSNPELITCLHEESSVAMAHGYFKAEGKPLAIMAHGTVGLESSGISISTTSGSATRAAAESATVRRLRSGRRWPTAGTAGCPSRSRPTAT